MTAGVIIQARMSSARLPGKMLREVNGKPLLQYLLERLEHARLADTIVVATSDDPSDDPLAVFCAAKGVDCHRGPLDDVAGRLLAAAETRSLDRFVRVTGDSPLLDQQLVDRSIGLLSEAGCELATNVFPRSFPRGQSVEAFSTEAFRRGYESMTDADDLEHATPYFYAHPDEFRICSFGAPSDLSSIHLAIDTPADFDRFASILRRMTREHWSYSVDEVLLLAQQEPDSGSS